MQLCPELAVSDVFESCVQETRLRKSYSLPALTVGEVIQYFSQSGTAKHKRVCELLFRKNRPKDWFVIDKGGYLAIRSYQKLTLPRRVTLFPSPQ